MKKHRNYGWKKTLLLSWNYVSEKCKKTVGRIKNVCYGASITKEFCKFVNLYSLIKNSTKNGWPFHKDVLKSLTRVNESSLLEIDFHNWN